jgi:hypothetical protein
MKTCSLSALKMKWVFHWARSTVKPVNSNPVKWGHLIWSQIAVLKAIHTLNKGYLWIRDTFGLFQGWERASGAVVARPTPMRKVQGSRPVRDKDLRVRMRRPNYLGLVTLTSFGWDDKLRSSVCTHSEHPSTHYKDPAVSVRKSPDCGNIQKAACTVYPVWSLPVILRIELGQVKGSKREEEEGCPYFTGFTVLT